ncbi:MAG: glycosyltransferase family 2 protein [Alphaproteobacteria bacterium]|nr:glycosyltransferase family 2 protein [Alphaproteobacteria bacterium]
MSTVSLCMIVKDEEELLDKCLSSAADIVDEIVIVTTGNFPKTREIAEKYTDKIYGFEWIHDFSAARNFSFSHAAKEWILWLDADDYLREIDRENLRKLKTELSDDADVVNCRYNYSIDGAGKPTFFFDIPRLVKNDGRPRWCDPIHEFMELRGKGIKSDFEVCHGRVHTGNIERNVRIFEHMLLTGKEFSARNMYYYGRELLSVGRKEESAEWLEKFLDRGDGWVEDKIAACSMLGEIYTGDESLKALFRSFIYDALRPKICCAIGEKFLDSGNAGTAVFWYEMAMTVSPAKNGFIEIDYSEYIPAIQLCVCHWRLGDMVKSEEYNEMAAKFNPNSDAVATNRKLFAEQKQKL